MAAENFYLLEETIHLLQQIKKNLKMQELDPLTINLGEQAINSKIQMLIRNLDILMSAKDRVPRQLKLFVEVEGLLEFLRKLQAALAHSDYVEDFRRKKGSTVVVKINDSLARIIAGLDDWSTIAEQKLWAHQKDRFANSYLEHLPLPSSADYFYVFVKELNPVQTRYLHPFVPSQLARQKERSTEDLLKYDSLDPITGMRQFAAKDNTAFPGSYLRIIAGHHRTFELYRRFINGELSGDTLLLVKRMV